MTATLVGTIQVAQEAGAGNQSLTFVGCQAGDLILIEMFDDINVAITGVTCSGETFSPPADPPPTPSSPVAGYICGFFGCTVATSGTKVVTGTWATNLSGRGTIAGACFRGATFAGALTAYAQGTGTTGAVSINTTALGANAIAWIAGANGFGGEPGPDAGYTGVDRANLNFYHASAYNLDVGAIGAKTIQLISPGSGDYYVRAIAIASAPVATAEQSHARWRNDDGSETTATWAAAEDSNLTAGRSVNKRLRVQINATLDFPSSQFQLEYKLSTDSVYVPLLTAAAGIPTYQAAGTAQTGTAGVTVPWPASHQAFDVALLLVESCGGEPVSLTTPNGFAAVTGSPSATGTTTNGTQITAYWCRATGASMASPVVADPGDHVYAQIITFRGCVAEGNPWDVTAAAQKASASTSASAPTVTTTVANCLIVNAIARDTDSAAAAFSAEANASLSSLTERIDAGTVSGNGGGFGIYTGGLAAAGASGVTTATVSSSINASLTIALRPQPPVFLIAASSNITASGQSTTAQLSAPSGKSTSDFVTGRMQDDENPADAVDITTDDYTELEWCLAAGAATADGTYNWRVTQAGAPLATYTVTPSYIVTSTVNGVSKDSINVRPTLSASKAVSAVA